MIPDLLLRQERHPLRPVAAPERPWGARERRPDWIALGVLLLVALGVWLPRLRGPLDLRFDAGVYYILGTSLAEGHGYRLLNEPGAIEAIQYPPLLPLFAAAHQWVAGTSDPLVVGHLLRISFAVIFVLLIAAVYLLARRYLSPGFAFLVGLITVLHADQIWLSDLFHAEMPFTLVTILFLLARGARSREVSGGVAAVLGWAAFLLRSAGIALLIAWVGESVLRRRFRTALLRAALAAVPFLGWQLYVGHVEGSEEYQRVAYPYQRAAYQFYNVGYRENLVYRDPFTPELGYTSPGEMAERVLTNFASMPPKLGGMVSSRAIWAESELERINDELPARLPLWVVQLPLLLLAAGVLGGLVLLAGRGEYLIPLYTAGSISLIALTPWPGQFERYLAPLTPLLAIALCASLVGARAWLAERQRWRQAARALVPAMVIGIMILQLFPLYKVFQKRERAEWPRGAGGSEHFPLFYYTPAWQEHAAALNWLAGRAGPGEVTVTSTPHWLYLRNASPAVMPPYESDVREAQRLVDAVPGRYLVVDALEVTDVNQRYVLPMLAAFPERWELVYASPHKQSRIFRRVGSGGKTGSRPPEVPGARGSRADSTKPGRATALPDHAP